MPGEETSTSNREQTIALTELNNQINTNANNENNYDDESEGEIEERKLKEKRKTSFRRFSSRKRPNLNRQKSGFEYEDDEKSNKLVQFIEVVQTLIINLLNKYGQKIKKCFLIILLILYLIYVGFSLKHKFGDKESYTLLGLTIFLLILIGYNVLKPIGIIISNKISGVSCGKQLSKKLSENVNKIRWGILIIIYILWISFVIIDIVVVSKEYENLISGCGILFFIFMSFIFSYNPAKVKWRPVLWGLGLQGAFAVFILRTNVGFDMFTWIGDKFSAFIRCADAGSIFVFGNDYIKHYIAFKIMPVIAFMSTFISVLYYWGVVQAVVKVVAYVMQVTMGTTAGESLTAAANIFIGQTEAPLIIKPLLPLMTRSELHSCMTGGFATIAGAVMGAYMSFGVPANHLLSASVLSAPAALAVSKLFYPETLKSKTTAQHTSKILTKGDANNFLEAAAKGAFESIGLVATIIVNLIAFTAFLELLNTLLEWFGERIGLVPPEFEPLTFQYICSYVFLPIVVVMGVPISDARRVSSMIGIKIILNEFIAYKELQVFISNNNQFSNWTNYYPNETMYYNRTNLILSRPENLTDITLIGGLLKERSVVISTYALCGFSNVASIGSALGIMLRLAPNRSKAFTQIAFRAMVAGNIACFLTACVAGLLFKSSIEN